MKLAFSRGRVKPAASMSHLSEKIAFAGVLRLLMRKAMMKHDPPGG
jgi:hypothetical protein